MIGKGIKSYSNIVKYIVFGNWNIDRVYETIISQEIHKVNSTNDKL